MTSDSTPTPLYRWLKVQHPDLLFWGIEAPLPWPVEEERAIDPKTEFPFGLLLIGIERLRAAGREWGEKWEKIEDFMHRGDELGEALESGDMRTTLRLLDELEALRPGTAYYSFNRAFALRALGEGEAALAAAIEATRRAPKLEHIWMRCGDLHEAMKDLAHHPKAVRCYRRALALLPGHQQALEGLCRLGQLTRLTEVLPDGSKRVRFYTPEQFLQTLKARVATLAPDHAELRDLLDQAKQNDPAVQLVLLDRILQSDPDDVAALKIRRADTLRLMKRMKQAERVLQPFLNDDEVAYPEAHYVQAWCHFDSGRNAEGWNCIRDTLMLDPNHQQAIQAKFRLGPNNRDARIAEEIAAWAERNQSWRGHWLAAVHCSIIGQGRAAVRHAEAAYKMAPHERDALLYYATSLNNLDEGEYTAALVHPRLPEAKGDYLLKYVYAGAMKKLGLPELAIGALRESLAEDEMPEEWEGNLRHFLDELTGMMAESGVDLEFHDNTDVMRREVWAGADAGPETPLLQSGASVPLERFVRMSPRPGYTGSTGSMQMYHHGPKSEQEPKSLGWFQAHEIDFGAAEPPMMMVRVTDRRKLEATARQGERRLPVTWSFYRAPSMEYDPSTEGRA